MQLEVARDGKTYAGEAIFSKGWTDDLGLPPAAGVAFRLVFLNSPATVDPAQVQSGRIVVFTPGQPSGDTARAAEAPATYTVVKNEADLTLTADRAEAYSLGSFLVGSRRDPDPTGIFTDDGDVIPLASLALLADLDGIGPEISRVRSYLEDARPQESEEELYLDRLSLLEQLSEERIFRSPAIWSSIQALFDLFKSRYVGVYVRHHRQHRTEVVGLRQELGKALPKVSALRLLNGIDDLGVPEGESALVVAEGLVGHLTACGLQEIDLGHLQTEPLCPTCRVPLDIPAPAPLVRRTLLSLDGALATQMTRLSQRAVSMVLMRPDEPRLEQFLRVVQAADPAGLAQVMDEELADFLKRLLGQVVIEVSAKELHLKLLKQFPDLDAEQTTAFGEAMADLLDEGAKEGKTLNPGKRIRLRIV
jgi:hypothetical protein